MSQNLTPKFAARILATQALYQAGVNGEVQIDSTVREFIGRGQADRLEDIGAKAFDQALFADIATSAFAQSEDLDNLILAVLSDKWSLERIDPVLLALLRAAAFELSQSEEDAPQKLVSQYVQIAQGFFGGKEPGLVNASLDALAKALHPDKFDE